MNYDSDKWAKYETKHGRGESDVVSDITSAILKIVIGAAFGLCFLGLLGSAVGALWFLLTPSTDQIVEQPPQVAKEVVAVAPIIQEEPKKEEIVDPMPRYVELLYALPDVERQLFENTTRWQHDARLPT